MKVNKQLKQELSSLTDFSTMIEAYEEISAIRMRKVKKSVLARREFMQGLNDAFAYIAYAYKVYKQSVKKGAKEILNTNGRTATILLSSNTGLYGDIIKDTFDMFYDDVSKNDVDVVIVGKLGKRFYDNQYNVKQYKYFEISDTGLDDPNVKEILEFLTTYTHVIVYHGVFKSILKQEPRKTYATGEVVKITENLKDYNVSFIFEPNVQQVAEYFEKQILSLIFEQTIFESSLSKFASRMVSLDAAADNIHKKLSFYDFQLQKAKHKEINGAMQATLTGGMLWN